MATTKKKRNKSAKPPTAKQLKARRAFTRMAKLRAKEARQRNRLAARNGRSAALGRRSSVKKKKPRNPGVIRFSETDARRYGGKIKGFSSRTAKPAAKSKSRKVKRFKKAGIFAGKGFLGLGRSKRRIKVRNGATCIRNGKRIYGAAAQAVLNSRANRNGTLLSDPKKPKRNKARRRNQAPAGVAAMHETFLGQPVRATKVIPAPEGTPRDVAVIGQIVELKSETETFKFKPGEAPLGANARGDLFVLGKTKVESNADFGKLLEISYVAKKHHLDGKLTEYFHQFGEEGGRRPKLQTDREGMFHIVGGSYSIQAEGITD